MHFTFKYAKYAFTDEAYWNLSEMEKILFNWIKATCILIKIHSLDTKYVCSYFKPKQSYKISLHPLSKYHCFGAVITCII